MECSFSGELHATKITTNHMVKFEIMSAKSHNGSLMSAFFDHGNMPLIIFRI